MDEPDAAADPANDGDEGQAQALEDTSKPPKRVKLDPDDAEPADDSDADNDDVEEVNFVAADGDGDENATVVIDMTSNEWDNIDDFDLDDYDFDEWEDPGSDVGQVEAKPKKDDSEFTILTIDQIYAHMDEVVNDVSSVLRFKPHVLRTLLNAFNWKKDKLLEAYYENDERFAHLFKVAKLSPFPSDPLVPDPNMIIECGICFNEQKHKHTHALDCGHRFCDSCWTEHLTNKIKNEGNAHTIFCPSTKCDTVVDHDTVGQVITDPSVLEKYRYQLVKNYVQTSEVMSWCLSPTSCTFGIRVETLGTKRVTCTCGYSFCFGCKREWHDPITCDLLTKWLKKCSDDSETAKWIQTHTKDCPRCSVQIEKNGGCNHMTCRNKSCRHEFCWLCMGNWPHKAGDQCNRFVEGDEGGKVQEDPGKNKARTSLKRYIFYNDRYMNHKRSLLLEHRLHEITDNKIKAMQNSGMSWIDAQFLKKAVTALCRCRQTLMYTYSFAYYLDKNNQCHIFEGNQADLEAATEALSDVLENGNQAELVQLKQSILDKVGYCETRAEVLIGHVYENYSKNLWVFVDEP